MQQPGYIAPLDGLRALAAIIVLLFHSLMPYTGGGSIVGVGAFFVLSGFLITRLIADEYDRSGTFDYAGFQFRRIARLAPLVAVVLTAFVIVAPFLFPKAKLWQEVLPSLLYYSNLSFILFREPLHLQHMWSLAVEMQFYLAWPLLIIAILRNFRSDAARVLFAVFMVFLTWRLALRYGWDSGFHRSYYSPDNAAPSFALGGWIALSRVSLRPATANAVTGIALLAYGLLLIQTWKTVQSHNALFLSVNDAASAGLIFALLQPGSLPARLFATPVPVALGHWSYGIYAWHYPIARLVRGEMPGFASATLVFLISVALAVLTYHLVEKPGRRWVRQFLFGLRSLHMRGGEQR